MTYRMQASPIRRTLQNDRRPGEGRDPVTLLTGTDSESNKEMSNLHAPNGLST